MKVTFKTLNQQTFVLELKEDDLVSDVKKKIQEERGCEYDAGTQKLIHSGKVMEDHKYLKDYKVSDSGFVVVMSVAKSKEISKETCSSNSELPQVQSTVVTSVLHSKTSPVVSTASTPATVTSKTLNPVSSDDLGTSEFGESALVTGSDYDHTVQELTSMGFDKQMVVDALKASFNNPDRAFDYLSSGNIPNVDYSQPTNAEANPQERVSDENISNRVQSSENPVFALANLPQFQQMRALVQANPELLPRLIQQIGADNSELLTFIRENEQAFLDFLNSPLSNESTERDNRDTSAINPTSVANTVSQRPVVLTMTSEEHEAVDRLKALGFSEELVIQAYYACEKNEDAAANFLLSEEPDDEMV